MAPDDEKASTADQTQPPVIKQPAEESKEMSKEISTPTESLEKEPATEEHEYPGIGKLIIIILGLYLAVLLVALDQTIIGTAIPKITDQFKSIEDVGWYGSAYFLTSTALQPSFGRIYRIFSLGGKLTKALGKMGIPHSGGAV
ncbi:Major Facilitator Superfamily [Aspergillus sclerotialis]|uniref:Major Facilitator Superfamily n=1 Tax=Aspergillus sclerotialis TaxID=2070753 RepID=A0A3A2ZSU4_9EURO|nr:Major Facilitator Superfamily [Aspergillus sclerotialis]